MEHQPDGGHTAGDCHLFILDDLADLRHIENIPAGQYLLDSHSQADVGQAPPIGVKHGNYMEDAIALEDTKSHSGRITVEHDAPVGVDNTLRIARCRRGIAHHGRRFFIQVSGKIVFRGELRYQVVIEIDRRQGRLGHLVAL